MHRVVGGSAMDDFIPLIRLFSKSEEKHKAVHERRDKFLQNLIEEIRGIDESKSDMGKTMIEVLLSLQGTDPHYYTDEIIKAIIAVLFQAGNDTSVATMEWAMTLLLNNPKVLEKAQAEIYTHIGPDRLINDSDLTHLPYLNSIIKETLRLYPVLPFFLPHQSSEKSIISGFHVPKGTMVFINAWAIQNDPEIWDDPSMFMPERFMKEEGINKEFKYMPFGKGRRGCPGEQLATLMIGLALGSILQCFYWERVSEELEDLSEGNGFMILKNVPLMAKCWPRESMVNLLSQI